MPACLLVEGTGTVGSLQQKVILDARYPGSPINWVDNGAWANSQSIIVPGAGVALAVTFNGFSQLIHPTPPFIKGREYRIQLKALAGPDIKGLQVSELV